MDMTVRQPDDRSASVRAQGGGQVFKRDRSPRVLCATDLLPRSHRAVSRADAIARELGAQLLLLHVVDGAGSAHVSRRRGARARFILDAHARKLARSGDGAQVSVRAGRPHQTIAEVAMQWDADLIVLGPYRRRFGDSFRGTTAERIIRIADRPVLVVNRDSADPYEHVLMAADLSRMSIGVAHVTKELGLLGGARASVVHALQHARGVMPHLAGVSESEVGKYQQSLRELASHEIDTLLASAGLDSARVSVFSQENSPFRAIEQVASRIGSDLVVVGTSRFPLFKRVFVGSVSNEVLRGIEHDVLVISPVAARRAHRRAWTAARRAALGAGHECRMDPSVLSDTRVTDHSGHIGNTSGNLGDGGDSRSRSYRLADFLLGRSLAKREPRTSIEPSRIRIPNRDSNHRVHFRIPASGCVQFRRLAPLGIASEASPRTPRCTPTTTWLPVDVTGCWQTNYAPIDT